jgi:hypothetical protein
MKELPGPEVGQSVSLDVFGPDGRRVRLQGRVAEADSSKVAVVLVSSEQLLSTAPGSDAMVECHDEHGNLRFMSRVVEMRLAGHVQVVLEAPPHVARLQTRRFVRHGLKVPVHCSVIDPQGGQRERYSAFTEDLGGNGARLVADRAMSIGTLLALEIDLGSQTCSCVGQVKHSTRAGNGDKAGFLWGVEFTRMDGKNLARLWSFLRARQQGG